MDSRGRESFCCRLALLLMALGFSACGGGDGPMFETPDAAGQTGGVGGYWVGQFRSESEADVRPLVQVQALTTEQGNAQFIFQVDAETHIAGSVAPIPESVLGDVACYLGSETPFIGTEGKEPMLLTGQIEPRDVWTGSYKSESDAGGFNLDYSATYEYPSSIDRVTGMYSYTVASSSGAAYSLTMEVDDAGNLFGQDTTGCVYSGTISVIDARYNMYNVSMSIDLCGEMDGQYAGLATLQPGSSGELTSMVLAASSGTKAMAVRLN